MRTIQKFDNTQEKNEKSWRGIENDYLENFALVQLRSVNVQAQ